MSIRKSISGPVAALVGAGALFLAATTAQAAMSPAPTAQYSSPNVQLAWCAVGANIGPLGACVGTDHPYYGHSGYWHHHCWTNHWGHRICN
jgi:hypothetical protein